jgi:TIR domain/SIR2-like domain
MNVDDLFWDDLLLYLEQNQVIPILGRDLLVVESNGVSVNAIRLLAERLADELKIPRDRLPEDFGLSQVIAAYPRFREKRNLIYIQTKAVFDRLGVSIPEPLRLLAEIPAFRIFITTTFDSWMESALIEARFGGRSQPLAIAYSPEHAPDISPDQLTSDKPVVFQLFGRVCPTPHYAVTEEDLLEYLHHLQARPPKNLCDALRDHHLLFIGNAFSDWLARFFIRTARGERLISQHGKEVFIVDSELRRSASLVSFFEGFCWETNVLTENTPTEFVRMLHEKWFQRHPKAAPASAPPPSAPPEVSQTASHSIFISYASEDFESANRLRTEFDKVGLNAWMDKKGGLIEGDLYQAKIRQDIWRCTLFVPVLSRNADRRNEGFFREEWHEAIKRTSRFKGAARPFLMPVVIDDLDLYRAENIPEEFKEIHVTLAPGGVPHTESAVRIQQIIRNIVKTEGSAP